MVELLEGDSVHLVASNVFVDELLVVACLDGRHVAQGLGVVALDVHREAGSLRQLRPARRHDTLSVQSDAHADQQAAADWAVSITTELHSGDKVVAW